MHLWKAAAAHHTALVVAGGFLASLHTWHTPQLPQGRRGARWRHTPDPEALMLSCCCLRLRVHSLVGGLRKRGGHVAGRGARLAGRVRSFAARCAAACCRRRRIRANVAAWWSDKVVARALRRAWLAAALRVESRKADDGGILKLHEDVQMCGYEDVQVMWEMLRRTEMEPLAKQQRKRPFWRLSCSSSSSSSSSSSWSSCSRASSIEPHHHY